MPFWTIEFALHVNTHRKSLKTVFIEVINSNIFSVRQEVDLEALGTTDRRLIKQEERRLEEIFRQEIEAFIDHLR